MKQPQHPHRPSVSGRRGLGAMLGVVAASRLAGFLLLDPFESPRSR